MLLARTVQRLETGGAVMRRAECLLAVALLPLLLSAADSGKSDIEVHFSPGGGCTDAVVREIGQATKSIHPGFSR
jgi:hypothetical protein